MGHCIKIFLARAVDHMQTFIRPPFLGALELEQGFVATPLEDSVIDALGPEPTAAERIEVVGRRLSSLAPVLFLATEYFGGEGGKEVAAWREGECVFIGQEEVSSCLPEGSVTRCAPLTATDLALAATFGSDLRPSRDAFAALGLPRWRKTEDIVEALAGGMHE